MEQILTKHPDLQSILKIHRPKTYKNLTITGAIIDAWELNEDGHYIDVTEREKLKAQIIAEQAQLQIMLRAQMKEKQNGTSTSTMDRTCT